MTTSGVRESGRQCPPFDHPEHIDPRHRILGEFPVLRYCRQEKQRFFLDENASYDYKTHSIANFQSQTPRDQGTETRDRSKRRQDASTNQNRSNWNSCFSLSWRIGSCTKHLFATSPYGNSHSPSCCASNGARSGSGPCAQT